MKVLHKYFAPLRQSNHKADSNKRQHSKTARQQEDVVPLALGYASLIFENWCNTAQNQYKANDKLLLAIWWNYFPSPTSMTENKYSSLINTSLLKIITVFRFSIRLASKSFLDCSCWMESLSCYEVLAAGDLLEHALQLHKVGIETLKNRSKRIKSFSRDVVVHLSESIMWNKNNQLLDFFFFFSRNTNERGPTQK